MQPIDENKIFALAREGGYKPQAYVFTIVATHNAVAKNGGTARPKHVCEMVRDMAVDEFGYLAKTVLTQWGVHHTSDIGKIMGSLVKADIFRQEAEDDLDDFNYLYDYDILLHEDNIRFRCGPHGPTCGLAPSTTDLQ